MKNTLRVKQRPAIGILLVFVACLLCPISADIFDSVASLKSLIQNEDWLVEKMHEYIAKEEERLQKIKTHLERISSWSAAKETLNPTEWSQYVTEVVEHPVNAFNLIKDWVELSKLASGQTENFEAVKSEATARGIPVPDDSDYRGAIKGLVRLQKTYSLPTQQLADGIIYNVSAKRGLEKSDFLQMGRLFMDIEHGAAISWFEMFLRAGVPEAEVEKQVYTNMMQIYKQAEDFERAWITAHKILQKDPNNDYVRSEMTQFKRNIEIQQKRGTFEQPRFYWKSSKDRGLEYYEALCRGDQTRNKITMNKNLTCVYRKGILPYIQYKEEIHSINPRISLFIDVISDRQAELMKEKALPALFRAQVGDPSLGLTTDERVSKLAWLWDWDPEIHKISQKVADITGLSTTYRDEYTDAEPFQVVNYGIGGQYEPHYDYYEQEEMLDKLPSFLKGTGDRISTFMFYLSQAVAGGATVFPSIGVRVPPIKNAAAYWYNFNMAGDRDTRTLHAGCPLLLGQKWVGNKWIRQAGQTFLRRCSLAKYATDPIWYS